MSNIAYVEVRHNPTTDQLEADPPELQLHDGIDHVVWWCSNLPPDGLLQILFDGSAEGPFVELQTQNDLVIGSGNAGLVSCYPYLIRVQASQVQWQGQATVDNLIEEPDFNWESLVCETPRSGPPVCY